MCVSVCVCIYIYIYIYTHGVLVAKSCQTLGTQWTVACQAPLSMGFSRQEHRSGLPFPSPGIYIHIHIYIYIYIYIYTNILNIQGIYIYIYAKILNIQGTVVGPYDNTCHYKKVNAKLGVF